MSVTLTLVTYSESGSGGGKRNYIHGDHGRIYNCQIMLEDGVSMFDLWQTILNSLND